MLKSWLKNSSIALFILCICLATASVAEAQCSICTKTAAQLGEEPARGLNAGIIYLALTPFAIVGFIGYRWMKREKQMKS